MSGQRGRHRGRRGHRRECPPWKLASAKRMRKNPTEAERVLWQTLCSIRPSIPKFRRQALILGWIADYYCPQRKLVVEVDGPYHQDRLEYDRHRDEVMLTRLGIRTLRLTNEDVLTNPQLCIEKIRIALDSPSILERAIRAANS